MSKREAIPLSLEASERFKRTFEIRPELSNDPEVVMAYEYASAFKLYPDEMLRLAPMIRRRTA